LEGVSVRKNSHRRCASGENIHFAKIRPGQLADTIKEEKSDDVKTSPRGTKSRSPAPSNKSRQSRKAFSKVEPLISQDLSSFFTKF